MRTITADYIVPVSSPPIKNGIISIEDDGTVIEIGNIPINHQPSAIIHYDGVVCPGFINTHCHLELSYLKGHLTEKAGMTGFIREIVSKRGGFDLATIKSAIEAAEKEMISEGIVAVGDISNDDFTFEQKAKGNLIYHTFLEVFDFNPSRASQAFEKGKNLQTENHKLQTSISPHAPYTLSAPLAKLISQNAQGGILTIHNQESQAEDDFFRTKTGSMKELYDKAGFDTSHLTPSGRSSLHYTLENLSGFSKLLLVHNTYTSNEDIRFALRTSHAALYWCTCPNANLYIENKLPDYDMFIAGGAKMTIGTDSYASNHSLSMLAELKTISQHYPAIGLPELVTWATLNGAEFLGLSATLGSLEKGKRPGLVHISHTDGLKLTPQSRAAKI